MDAAGPGGEGGGVATAKMNSIRFDFRAGQRSVGTADSSRGIQDAGLTQPRAQF